MGRLPELKYKELILPQNAFFLEAPLELWDEEQLESTRAKNIAIVEHSIPKLLFVGFIFMAQVYLFAKNVRVDVIIKFF